jgi:hypothetical protein
MSGPFGKATLTIGIVAALASGCGSSHTQATAPSSDAPQLAPTHGRYSPTIRPADFVATIDNRYLPFKPGTAYHYEGVKGKTAQTDDEVVLHQTKTILGIKSTVVEDTVSEGGKAVERTYDYYAQDKHGNVWYMGELSLERQHGRMVKASDSWLSGVNGGKPGIIMPGHPKVGDAYRQEYYPPGEALDEATVIGFHASAKVPYGSYKNLLATSERSPLEPQTEEKYYARGLGELKEEVVKGHHEVFELVSVKKG